MATPLVGAGRAEGTTISDFRKENILAPGLDNPDQLETAHEIGFWARAISGRRAPDERDESVRIDQTDLPVVGQISRLAVDRPALAISPLRRHLNCGTIGALMCGGGSGATFCAFAIPLGSTT
jgi:hypothetical protein